MPRKAIGDRAMTAAERMRKYRAAQRAAAASSSDGVKPCAKCERLQAENASLWAEVEAQRHSHAALRSQLKAERTARPAEVRSTARSASADAPSEVAALQAKIKAMEEKHAKARKDWTAERQALERALQVLERALKGIDEKARKEARKDWAAERQVLERALREKDEQIRQLRWSGTGGALQLGQAVPKLAKMLRMLGSSEDGDVVNTVRAIGRALKGAGRDWHDLANPFDNDAAIGLWRSESSRSRSY
jgi:hypothetical protein